MVFLTAFQTAIVGITLIAHLASSHQLRQGLFRALFVMVMVLAISNVVLPLVSGIVRGIEWIGWVIVSAPAAIAFVLGSWKVTRSRDSVMGVKSM